jgi:hypothetical protein
MKIRRKFKLKILPCKEVFKKPEESNCYTCSMLGDDNYCYGLLNFFRNLRFVPGDIIRYIKNLFDNNNDIPF